MSLPLNGQRGLLLVLVMTALAACTPMRDASLPDWDKRRDILLQIPDWTLRGRIAIRTVSGDGGQATINWSQAGESSALSLSGPFGAGRVELQVEPGQVLLSTADGETRLAYTGPDAIERFMAEQLGWSFPVRSARFWMRGVLDPAAPGERIVTTDGYLSGLEQHGWNIALNRFSDSEGLLLPDRLVLENPQLRLKVAISEWQ